MSFFLSCTTLFEQFIRPSVSESICLIDSHLCRYSFLGTARLLLECAADVNARDLDRNTPLRLLVSNHSTAQEALLSLLCDAGAHLDCASTNHETLPDIVQDPMLKLSLKCLCACIIRRKHLPFHGFVSLSLVHSSENY